MNPSDIPDLTAKKLAWDTVEAPASLRGKVKMLMQLERGKGTQQDVDSMTGTKVRRVKSRNSK